MQARRKRPFIHIDPSFTALRRSRIYAPAAAGSDIAFLAADQTTLENDLVQGVALNYTLATIIETTSRCQPARWLFSGWEEGTPPTIQYWH